MALPPSSKYLQRAGDPVDDVERESLTARLNAAYADGTLQHDQYSLAMDAVYGARTLGDLVPVVEQLPPPPVNEPALVVQSGPPAGEVATGRNLLPMTLLVGAVGITLIVVLAVLIGILLF